MNSNHTHTHDSEHRAYRKLLESELFKTYQQAFRSATGMDVHLVPADEEADYSCSGNRFCQLLNTPAYGSSCRCSHAELAERASERTATQKCHAGLTESAIPIRSGSVVVAYLHAGHVFTGTPSQDEFDEMERRLKAKGIPELKMRSLREAYLETSTMPEEKYRASLTVLAAFALQLTQELNRIVIAQANSEPAVVVKAKQFVNAHLDERITLDAVSAHVHVSPFYFCKIFKQATGMTLTEYVNRRRVECAKRRLLNPQARVTEIAYDVGYQSLSQFNRSFQKYVGESPTEFRARPRMDERLAVA